MTHEERNLAILRIVSGLTRVEVKGRFFLVDKPTFENKLIAEELWAKVMAETDGHTQDSMVGFLIGRGIWKLEEDVRTEILHEEIENLCVGIFENRTKDNVVLSLRADLKNKRAELNRLLNKKHCCDYLTKEYLANLVKIKFLIGSSLSVNGKKYWKNPYKAWNKPDEVLDRVLFEMNKQNLQVGSYRELAREEPFRSIWNARKSCSDSVFGCPAGQLTEHQLWITFWATVYENSAQNEDFPGYWVTEDDDMFDGWMIIQRRKREKEEQYNNIKHKISPNIAKSQEIFVVAESERELKDIESLNDSIGRNLKRSRLQQVQEKGQLSDAEFADRRLDLQMILNRGG